MYSRFGTPTVHMLQDKLADIEGAEVCWCTSTGMAAVFTIFMSFLKKGDRVVAEWIGKWKNSYEKATDSFSRNRIIADYIAGMTDRFALYEHKKLYDFNKGW